MVTLYLTQECAFNNVEMDRCSLFYMNVMMAILRVAMDAVTHARFKKGIFAVHLVYEFASLQSHLFHLTNKY